MSKPVNKKVQKITDVVAFRNETSTGKKVSDIFLMDVIDKWWGENLPKIKELITAEKPTSINLHIVNCPGGDVGEALAIKGFIRDYNAPVKTIITGFVASAATIVAMAGDEVIMKEDALWLVHNASTGVWGNKEEIKKVVDDLETVDNLIASIYTKKTGMDKTEVVNLMNENKWITAEEALNFGFITKIVDKVKIAATVVAPTADDFTGWNLKMPAQFTGITNSNNLIDDMKVEIKNAIAGLIGEIKGLLPKNTTEDKPETPETTETPDTPETPETPEEPETPDTPETNIDEEIEEIEKELKEGNLTDAQASVIKNKLTNVVNEMKKMKGAKTGGKSNNTEAPFKVENAKNTREEMNDESLLSQIKNRVK